MTPTAPRRLDAEDFREQPVNLCGTSFIAHWSGVLYWPAEDALIVSGLELGVTPPARTADTLHRLGAALELTPATTVIALEGRPQPAGCELTAACRDHLRRLQDGRDWIWVTGGAPIASGFGGHTVPRVVVAGLTVNAVPAPGPVTHEIAGGMHPIAAVARIGHIVRRPCFVGNGTRLILPAFGAEGPGVNVLASAFDPLFGNDGLHVLLLGHEGLYPVAARLLCED